MKDGSELTPGPAAGLSEAAPGVRDDEFWEIVSWMDWKSNPDIDEAKIRLVQRFEFNQTKLTEFKDWMVEKKDTIYEALNAWCDENEKTLGIGDDGWEDLCSHIVGLGREEYEACLKNPGRAAERAWGGRFKESFSYCIPYDLDEFSWSTYLRWAGETTAKYEYAAVHPYASPIHVECGHIAEALGLVLEKKITEFLAQEEKVEADLATIAKFHERVSLKDADIENQWVVKNLFSDLKRYGAYLR
jgi:hypothetical protein